MTTAWEIFAGEQGVVVEVGVTLWIFVIYVECYLPGIVFSYSEIVFRLKYLQIDGIMV